MAWTYQIIEKVPHYCLIPIMERQQVMGNKEFDPSTNLIYTSCGTPIGKNVNGKVRWFKKVKKGL